jgi:hypothetical protein
VRALTWSLAACVLLSSAGCFSVRSRAEWKASKIQPGMDQKQVKRKLGDPIEKLPIPAQGADSSLPVEMWRYDQHLYFGMAMTLVLTLGIAMIFMDLDPAYYDITFGRDGRVLKVSEVYGAKDDR